MRTLCCGDPLLLRARPRACARGRLHGYYRRKDVATKSGLCYDCWSTYKPYMDESDEDEDPDDNPERHPNRLRWRWPGRLKAALDAEAKRERSARAAAGGSQAADGRRTARRAKRTAAADSGRTTRRPTAATTGRPPRRPAPRRPPGAAPAPGNTARRTAPPTARHAPPTAAPPPGSHPAPLPPPEPPPTLHPAPLPPPEPPPDPGPLESDDDAWTPYHIPAHPATVTAPDAARTDGSGRPPTPPNSTTSDDAAPAKRRKRNPRPTLPDLAAPPNPTYTDGSRRENRGRQRRHELRMSTLNTNRPTHLIADRRPALTPHRSRPGTGLTSRTWALLPE